MGKRIWESFLFSLEWRIYAFIITSLFLWATTGHLAFAAAQALGLQIILLFAHSTWYYFRQDGAHAFTLDALTTRLARYFMRGVGEG